MLILTAEDIGKALPMDEAIQAMKCAYASLSDGRAEVPLRTRLPIPGRDMVSLFMPAYAKSEDVEALALKVVSLVSDNPKRGLAFIQAAVLALDPQTGRPTALLEGASLTAIRTGAGSGAAIDILARADAQVVAVFGAGPQGRTQLEAACAARKIKSAFIVDHTMEKAKALAESLAGTGRIPTKIRFATNAKEAASNADIICAATTSSRPIFDDRDVRPGTHISAVGGYTPQMQEIPAETVARARVFVDSRSACLAEAGDLIQPIQAGVFDESHIFAELGEVILRNKPGRTSAEEITFFKSVGVAVQDAFAAQVAVKNAQQRGLGQTVDF